MESGGLECPKGLLETVKDFANTAIYLIGASIVDYIRTHAFPDGISFGTELVFVLLSFIFIVLTIRYAIDEIRCLEKSIMNGVLDHKGFLRQIALKDLPKSEPTEGSKTKPQPAKTSKRKRKK